MKTGYTAILQLLKSEINERPISSILLILAILVSGLLEGIGVCLLFPIFDLIAFKGPPASPLADKVNLVFSTLGIHISIPILLSALFLAFLVQSLAKYITEKIACVNRLDFVNRLRRGIVQEVFSSEWPFFLDTKCGELANSAITEAVSAGHAYYASMKIVAAGFIVLIYILFSFYISPQLSAIALALFLLGNQVLKIFNRKSFELGKATVDLNNRLHSMIMESLSGAKFIKQSAIEDNVLDDLSRLSDKLCATDIRLQMNLSKVAVFFEPLIIGFICVYFYVSAVILKLDIGSVMVFVFVFYRLYPKVSFINDLINGVLSTIPNYSNILKIRDRMANYQRKSTGKKLFSSLEAEIRLDGLQFSYKNGKKVIDGLDISFKKKHITALAGGSGSGKTTILDMLTGLLAPDAGIITVDEINLQVYDMRSWRRRISYVDQVPILFHDTINSNIRMMNPNAADEEILEAAKQAHAWEFIKDLPDGMATTIGDRGVRLSGGQKQRLVLARALVRKPDILILDEATSALDTHSESLIMETIENLRGKITIIVVAHRLSTIKNADRIYVIEQGRVVEEGTYQELVERGNVLARYHSLS